MIDEKQVSDDEPRQAALPQSASVMWDLSLKRYDVFRSGVLRAQSASQSPKPWDRRI